jgi:hypothetical protein
MYNLSPLVDVQVVDARHKGAKTSVMASVYKDETQLDAAITTLVGAANLPSLTMNDKVFAARSLNADKYGWISESLKVQNPLP